MALHTLEIRNGSLWAWGNNEFGQLGDGTTTNRTSPVLIGSDNHWLYVATAYAHSIAIKTDGTLWAWGFQPWSGSNGNPLVPVQIGTDNNWISISAGDSHNLALKSDGSLWSWGWNAAGELGLGNYDDAAAPTQIGNNYTWTSICAFSESSMAIRTDGSLWAWGFNGSGELGIGSSTNTTAPTLVSGAHPWKSVSGGSGSTAAIASDGSLWCWGASNGSDIPLQNGTNFNWTAVSGNWGLRANGTLWSFGNNSFSQLGSNNNWVSISANLDFNIATKADGSLWAWGANDYGQLGIGSQVAQTNPVALHVNDGLLLLAAGQSHSLMVKENGTLWAWGNNEYGQLGIGNLINQHHAMQVGNAVSWVNASARSYNSAAIRADGSLWTWGYNDYGQLGDGSVLSKKSPTQIGAGNFWVGIDVGDVHMLGLQADGSLWAWGKNSTAQLGDGTFAQRNLPVKIGNDNDWVAIAAGTTHSLALKANGTLWAWGWNAAGELGDNSLITRVAPVQIGNDSNWIAIDAGDLFSIALKADGSLWAWGSNTYGQLGLGNFSSSRVPMQIGSSHNWVSASAGVFHSNAINANGALYAWGNNSSGQLGIGNNTTANLPAQVGTDLDWLLVSGGIGHALAAKSVRSAFCATGDNTYGQLGDFTNTSRNYFTCFSLSDCNPPAAPTVPAVSPVCAGASALLTATGTGTIGWYNAATGGSWLGGGSQFITPALFANTTFYAQDSTCAASGRTAVTVSVAAGTPDAPGVYTQYICNGEPATLTAYGSSNGIIGWYDAPTGGNYLGGGPTFTTTILLATGDTLTNYYFYAQDSLCTASNSRTAGMVVVYPSFTPVFEIDTTICKGSVPPVLPATSLNGVTGTWSPAVVSSYASGYYVFTPNSGNYLECNIPVTLFIEVIDTPVAVITNLTGTSTLSCLTPSIQLAASGGTLYSWNNNWSNNASITVTNPGAYTILVTDINGCISEATVNINGSTNTPPASIINGIVNVCRFVGTADTVMFTVPVSDIATTYNWTVPVNVTILSGQGNDTLLVKFLPDFVNNRNKQIRVSAQSVCGNSNVYIHYLSAQAPPTPAAIIGSREVCGHTNPDTTALFSVNTISAASGYLWTVPTGAILVQQQDTSVSLLFSPTFSSGLLRVQSINNCGVSNSRSITVSSTRPVTPGLISGPTSVCLLLPDSLYANGRNAVYKIRLVPNALGYLWSVPSGANILEQHSSATDDSIIVHFDNYTSGNITVAAWNNCGVGETRSLTLQQFLPGTPGDITGPTDICSHLEPNGTIASYSITSGTNSSYYFWEIPSGSSNINGQYTNSISFLFPNNYQSGYISVRSINACGTSLLKKKYVYKGNTCGRTAGIPFSSIQKHASTNAVAELDAEITPNPSTSLSTLRLYHFKHNEKIVVDCYDQQGRKIKTIITQDTIIPLGNEFGRGWYIINISQGKHIIRRKMIRI